MSGYNKTQAKQIISNAERTINIVGMILDGKTMQEIVAETNADRTLVLYYFKRLSK